MDQIIDKGKAATVRSASPRRSAGVALILAALGIYGVMSFAVAQRTHEIGLRMAPRRGHSNVLKLVLKEGVLLALAGLALGLAGAYFVGRGMQSIVFGVGAIDYQAFSIVALLLMLPRCLPATYPRIGRRAWTPCRRCVRNSASRPWLFQVCV